LSAFTLILLVFLFPETKYHRSQSADSTSNIDGEESAQGRADIETKAGIAELEQEAGRVPTLSRDFSLVGTGRPAKSNFGFVQRPDHRWRTLLLRDIISPFRVFFYPIIFWAGLMVAGPANLLLFWNLTESSVLGGSPYNFSTSGVGYANFAFVVGGLLGLVTAGPFSDWVAARATQRNDGIREAEMRLPALIPYGLLTAVGTIIGALGYQRLWPWEVILVVGYSMTGLAVTTIPTIAVAYAIDSYKPISGEIMVVATVLKNTCGFAMSYWVSPLAAKDGLLTPGMVEFALTIGPVFVAVPLYIWGKKLRMVTAQSNLHRLEEL
jgi:hypothetical protein